MVEQSNSNTETLVQISVVLIKISNSGTQHTVQSWLCEISFVTRMDFKLLMQLQNLDRRAKPPTGYKKDRRGPSKDLICSALLFYNACTPLSLSMEICNLEKQNT